MKTLKIIAPMAALIFGTSLVLSTVYAQNPDPSATNSAEQDTLDVPPGEAATTGTSPDGATVQQGEGGGQQGSAPPAAPQEDVDLPPPTPPPQPFVPTAPAAGTAPTKSVNDAPFMNSEAVTEGQGFEQGVDPNEELDWNAGAGMPTSPEDISEEQLEDEFARRMMELNEEVLNREYYPVFIYEDRDRRDPFMPILQSRQSLDRRGNAGSDLLQYDLTQLTLTAIAWNTKEPKALIRDPKSNIYMVKKRDPIGRNNGYVEDIREGEVIVVESRSIRGGQKFFSTQILRVGR